MPTALPDVSDTNTDTSPSGYGTQPIHPSWVALPSAPPTQKNWLGGIRSWVTNATPPFPTDRLPQIFGALYLMDGSIPPAILTTQLLGLRPTGRANIALIRLLGGLGKSHPMALLRSAMYFLGSTHVLDGGKFNPVRHASDFARVIFSGLKRAIKDQQPVGFELEFDPNGMSRDQAHIMMAKALRNAGHIVEIRHGHRDFVFQKQVKVAPIIRGHATASGQPVRTEIFQSNGTTLVSVVRDADTANTHVLAADQATSLADADVLLKSVLDAPPAENYLIIAKDNAGDTFRMQVDITGETTARLTGINGKFEDATGQLRDGIDIHFGDRLIGTNGSGRPQLEAILAVVKDALPEEWAIRKTNRITGLHVDGLGDGLFRVVDEVPPFLEAISAKMNVGDVGHTAPVVAAFRNGGFDGTRAAKLVGMHVHAEVTRQVGGQFSIAPVLNLLRAFVAGDQMIYNLFPSHPNRRAFIQRMPQAMRERLLDPDYVTDANDPVQILRVLADYVQMTPAKYADLNLDNYVGAMVDEMGRAGILKDEQVITDSYTPSSGRTVHYRLRVARGAGPDAPFRLYRHFEAGEVRQILPDGRMVLAETPVDLEVTRAPMGPIKPTAELRLFDSIMDPESVAFIAQFWGIFVHTYANAHAE